MITVRDLLDMLQKKAPYETAESWDHTGLAVGSEEQTITKVVVALDVTEDVLNYATEKQADIILTHHPLLFEPLKMLHTDSLAYRLAKADIAAVSAHTNLDKACGGVNDCLAEQLQLQQVIVGPDGMSRVGVLPQELSSLAFAEYVAQCLQTSVRIKEGTAIIKKVAICGGSGADLVLPLLDRVDAVVTAEIKHHEWLAVDLCKTVVDAGHYATEVVVLPRICEWLSNSFSELTILPFYDTQPYCTINK